MQLGLGNNGPMAAPSCCSLSDFTQVSACLCYLSYPFLSFPAKLCCHCGRDCDIQSIFMVPHTMRTWSQLGSRDTVWQHNKRDPEYRGGTAGQTALAFLDDLLSTRTYFHKKYNRNWLKEVSEYLNSNHYFLNTGFSKLDVQRNFWLHLQWVH